MPLEVLPTWTSDSCCYYNGDSLHFRLGLTHSFTLLFEPSDFSLLRGRITGLIGTNGSGKTSLAKVIASTQLAGFPSDVVVQYVSSHENAALTQEQASNLLPEQYMQHVVQEKLDLVNQQINEMEEKLAESTQEVEIEELSTQLAELYELQDDLQTMAEKEIQQTIEELGFSPYLDKPVSQLSSGWQYKCRLAAAFTSRPDILIIDEPSFLDKVSTEWLVRKTKTTAEQVHAMVLIISHKDTILERLCDRFWYINSANHSLSQYNCNYTEFKLTHQAQISHAQRTIHEFDNKMRAAESSLKNIQGQLKRREKNLKTITTQNADKRFIKGKNKEAKQKADRSAAAKVKQLKLEVSNIEEIKHQAQQEHVKPLKIKGTAAEGTVVLFQEVLFAYEDGMPPVFEYVDARIESTDRILLCGDNGSGKSTLLNLVIGKLEPVEGSVSRKAQALYFPQTALTDLTLDHGDESALTYLGENLTQTSARHHLGEYGLGGNVVLRSISSLSAGQRVRLWIAKQLLHVPKPSLLILDEVSENLDSDTKNTLIDILNSFVGAVIVVSHDEDFCTAFDPTQIWTVAEQRVRVQHVDSE